MYLRDLLAALVLGLPVAATAQSGTYTRMTLNPTPSAGSYPGAIVAGPDGAMWFTGGGNNIGSSTIQGTITEYPIPTRGSQPSQIIAGPDGALWFTEFEGNNIGRITTAGVITEYAIPTPDCGALGITRGPDDALWFVESLSAKIGRIDLSGTITEYPLTGLYGYAQYIATGPDGALWVTFENTNGNDSSQILRVTTAGSVTVYPVPGLPAGLEEPQAITVGSDGALWFAESFGNIFRVTTDGVFTQYPVPLPGDGDPTQWIAAGPDGALWFTAACNPCANAWIGRITTAGVITEFQTSSQYLLFGGIAAGPDGNVWFTTDGSHSLTSAVGHLPACGLGFSAGFTDSTLTMNFDLGIDTPVDFNIVLTNANGTKVAYSKPIPPVVPPHAFTMTWSNLPDLGTVTVEPQLNGGNGHPICAEWTTLITGQ
jgi:virginiamycin B lyase